MKLRPRGGHERSRHHEGIDADERYPRRAVVEYHCPHLTWVVQLLMKDLAVAARLLHTDRRRDVALGKARLQNLRRAGLLRLDARARKPDAPNDRDKTQLPDHALDTSRSA